MFAKPNAAIGLSAMFILLLLFYLGFWVSRDCYAASLFPRFYMPWRAR
ncbi:hypothetical protein ACS15_4781 [Ralstonia insidiosa]|uniref:Uncharacterized protein n=1 Tax=Ralstonia insidiosa TaxID=190721 RepID=A0AAC9BJV8_9RALS|nr:hypothetical protein ACS15_4781 [Ralstonia insidiosa]